MTPNIPIIKPAMDKPLLSSLTKPIMAKIMARIGKINGPYNQTIINNQVTNNPNRENIKASIPNVFPIFLHAIL